MNYTTYWSILDTPSKTIQSNSICLWIALISAILWVISIRWNRNKSTEDTVIFRFTTIAFFILGIVGYALLTFIYPDKTYEKTAALLNSNTTPRIEGIVSNFNRAYRKTRTGIETTETFTIDSLTFAYSDAALSKFNSFTETYNKVITNGKKLRITYSGNSTLCENCKSILKIEIENK